MPKVDNRTESAPPKLSSCSNSTCRPSTLNSNRLSTRLPLLNRQCWRNSKQRLKLLQLSDSHSNPKLALLPLNDLHRKCINSSSWVYSLRTLKPDHRIRQ
jgi:hypothetical protein